MPIASSRKTKLFPRLGFLFPLDLSEVETTLRLDLFPECPFLSDAELELNIFWDSFQTANLEDKAHIMKSLTLFPEVRLCRIQHLQIVFLISVMDFDPSPLFHCPISQIMILIGWKISLFN